MDIAQRLKSERERLALSQTDFGRLGGVGKTTVIAWERGDSYPNAAFLAAIAALGADVLFIVTGQRDYQPAPALSAEESLLLDQYRHAVPAVRRAALGALVGASRAEGQRSEMVFQDKVGQVIRGDATVHNFMGKSPKKAPPKG